VKIVTGCIGVAVTIVGDMNAERLAHAKEMGFEVHGHGFSAHSEEAPVTVLNSLMGITWPVAQSASRACT